MGGVQTLLSLAALMFFSLTALRFNAAVLNNSSLEMEHKVILTAISLADDMLEEIKVRAFDQNTVQFPTTSPLNLTPAANFGPDAGEVYPNFNDIDDYHGYSRLISAPHAEDYYVSVSVVYVDGSDPSKVSNTQTFYKRATINVSSPYMRNDIQLSFIFTLK